MELFDLLTSKRSLTISTLKKTYELYKFSLYHEALLEKIYPNGLDLDIEKWTFEDYKNLVGILYECLKDKTDFKAIEVYDLDENGNEVINSIGGKDLFVKSFVGTKDQLNAVEVLVELINDSRPQIIVREKKKT